MKLAVIREDGSTLEGDWATSIKHNLLVGIFGLIEFIMIVIGKPTIGQNIAKTRVVSLEP